MEDHRCDPDCDGWGVFDCDGGEDPRIEIERCDDCARFKDDDEARAHVARLVDRMIDAYLLYVDDAGNVKLRHVNRGEGEGG